MMIMRMHLDEARFDEITPQDKAFILAFTQAMTKLGYGMGGKIGPGYCWGKAMIIYSRNKKCLARIYIRERSILLRLYLSKIEDHAAYILAAPSFIKSVFTDQDAATCKHCHNEKDGHCRFRKAYRLEDRLIEKCNGITFEFRDPSTEKLPAYLELIHEFMRSKASIQPIKNDHASERTP